MFKRFMVLGSLTMLVLSGCNLFKGPELPLLPQSCEEVPPCCDQFYEPYLKVAQQVPAFGGLFLDEQDNSILYVYVTDLSQEEAVKKAIKEVFGPRWLELRMYPQEIRVLQGQYSFLQLKQWRDCLPSLAAIPGVVSIGIAMEKNRLHIGLDKNNKMRHRVVEAIEAALDRLGIPREAVILEFEEPPVLK